VGWIVSESVWIVRPSFADVFVGRETSESLQLLGEVIGIHEGGGMLFELPTGDIVER
jgi:hypothetical protein